jgi:hypothetical protein
MNQEELQEARVNPEFLAYLQEKEQEAIETKSISGLYEVLDTLLVLDLDEERIHKVYQEILKVAFDSIEERLKDSTKLSLDNDDIYFIRSFYEHAVEKWSVLNFDGARELFFILTQIIEDKKLSDAVKIHLIATANSKDMDAFYEEDVHHLDVVDNEKYGYFIHEFNFDVEEYLAKNSELLEVQYNQLKHLLN